MTTSTRDVVWPSLTPPPPAPVHAWAMERVFRTVAGSLPIRVTFPGGERIGQGGPGSPVMRVVRPAQLFRRMGATGSIGFGEAYMAGDWTSTDLAGVLTPFARRLTHPTSRLMRFLRSVADRPRPALERNTIDGARSNIHRHYDLSNEFFALFLDDSMTYSCAMFADGDDLRRAQLRKIDSILDLADVGPGTRVLELGSGWGQLAIQAARRGAHVTTATISHEQQRAVEERVAAAGVGDDVDVLLSDYREVDGQYDAVVSVEMIEAVGAEYWTTYFTALDRLLAPGGRVALQAITMPHDRMLVTKNVYTWIQKYVFPGGQLLSTRAIDEHTASTGLHTTSRSRFGDHYARTLACWRSRFTENERSAAALGFNETFLRMWQFYLAYCEAGFRAGLLDVWQLRLTK